jgi:2-dehydro-3-deoxy-D-arabinonate dehydratase
MKLYRTSNGIFVEAGNQFFSVDCPNWDELIRDPSLHSRIHACTQGKPVQTFDPSSILAPIGDQEVWAAGVTYYRSRNARIEESKDSGGGTFYDRVYEAERPELFFKATPSRVIGPGGKVRIRADATWSVPEPELTLLVSPLGEIIGYTIGNDMSSRDIEGENPLYLPQAKVYDASCALGPCILLSSTPLSEQTGIAIDIERGGMSVFSGATTLAELKRDPETLVSYLFRDSSFPNGVLLMTGTGVVPNDDFTLAQGDIIRITIDEIGTLENTVVQGGLGR